MFRRFKFRTHQFLTYLAIKERIHGTFKSIYLIMIDKSTWTRTIQFNTQKILAMIDTQGCFGVSGIQQTLHTIKLNSLELRALEGPGNLSTIQCVPYDPQPYVFCCSQNFHHLKLYILKTVECRM